ncbi:photosystem II subunit X [Actinidia rufa]|uniref:Photosystem II subunit X n=1 Tax=Actinidia rufa TaxID=165716 RepID=A0A7J0DVQ4_9ERIC|nr:photosystem II subunit X [Actinidia rufa]
MASSSAVLAAMPLTSATQKTFLGAGTFNPLPVTPSEVTAVAGSRTTGKFAVRASLKERAVTGLTAVALTASMVIPEVAEAAGSGVSPSLKNFLLSIAAGGVVLVVIVGAVIGVANFDPVKRS